MFNNLFQKIKHTSNKNSLNLLVFCDTHKAVDYSQIKNFIINNQDYNAIILLGDIEKDMLEFICKTNAETNNTPIYGILGNHDLPTFFDRLPIINLHNHIEQINGYSIGEFEGSIKYKESNSPLYTDEESVNILNDFPKCDIFITHDGPKDETVPFPHSGLKGITKYIQDKKPLYHLYGHRHHYNKTKINNTQSICLFQMTYVKINKTKISIQ